MMRYSVSSALPLVILVSLLALAPGRTSAQNQERPPARDFEGTPVLAAGIRVIPEGTFILLEMETPLNSKESKPSDRFRARIATPVVDAEGRTLIPEAAFVEGHVSAVTPAKWARRSGIIAVDFDTLNLPNGGSVPLRGYLTSAEAEDRKRIDDEGNIRGGPPRKRDIVFVGGGATVGAAIGLISGGALAGAGIGAAVGLTATLLMKGREAVVVEGQRIALGLTEDLKVEEAPSYLTPARPPAGRTEAVRPPRPASGSGSGNSRLPVERDDSDQQVPATGGPVNISAIRSERGADGLIRILVTAETPSTGWRIFSNHEIKPDTIEVRLRGVAPTALASRQVSHPTAPTIVIPDRNNRFKKIIVHGKNTVQTVGVNGSWTERGGSATKNRTTEAAPAPGAPVGPAAPGRRPSPSAGRTRPPEPSSASDTDISQLASRIEGDIDLIRFNYASSIGIWLNKDGTFEVLSGRRPTTDEKKFLDGLAALSNSVRLLQSSSSEAARLDSILRVREDLRLVESTWRKIPMNNENNQQVREMFELVERLTSLA